MRGRCCLDYMAIQQSSASLFEQLSDYTMAGSRRPPPQFLGRLSSKETFTLTGNALNRRPSLIAPHEVMEWEKSKNAEDTAPRSQLRVATVLAGLFVSALNISLSLILLMSYKAHPLHCRYKHSQHIYRHSKHLRRTALSIRLRMDWGSTSPC